MGKAPSPSRSTAAVLHDGGAWRASLALALVTLVGFGFAYSVAGTLVAGAAFPAQAAGSLIQDGDRVVGSVLVAQPFSDARYFQPRPSAAKYDPMSAAGSNQARSNPDLLKHIEETRAAVAKRDGIDPARVPSDLLTQSGSGLDPDITPASAELQVRRVAAARGLPEARVAELLRQQVQPRQYGVFGEPRVNVLQLNLALDQLR
ncbi:potassium-transporting ATPase subunit C [Stenotrophomonas panacihumi]|uniref:Potassium-transporting ATPase KdpC subunit n=1 Tax=Stenotrophomonas panacihumi TaxID=676599 RepID=A0A0R0A262_9GAMM|nr:potassium-transporting ATPase subunit KdpC [Stenotrophomonas panacihumi]KRG39279.1 potassium-transporting ATPase subunit C [Stenotrophomonas panacihumi]PTN55280.1 potassium-transporting ATPase subunit KdpC [Stenotrophomonas panacihumi]